MYVSDYMYGMLPEKWTEQTSEYNSGFQNWMGKRNWTISRDSVSNKAWLINNVVKIVNANMGWYNVSGLSGYNQYTINSVRPTFYITSETKLASGDGSEGNPFRLVLD